MFPAGLGGDDKRFLLKGLVCGHCNTDIFSPLELQFMRSSPVALGRIFLQPHGRGKGRKASRSSLQTKSATIADPNENILLEVELQPSGKPVVLPQFVFTDRSIGIIIRCSDPASATNFLDSIRALLADKLSIIEKASGRKTERFHITGADWSANGYSVGSAIPAKRPPERGLWIDKLQSSVDAKGPPNFPRLFQRPTGQFVLRVDDETRIGPLLTALRTKLGVSNGQITAIGQKIEQPSLHMTFDMQIDVMERVLAKIGVNFAIHELGDAFVRHSGFDEIKKAILLGGTRIRVTLVEDGTALKEVFSAIPHSLHAMALTAVPEGPGQCHLALLIQLYGSSTWAVSLAENVPRPSVPLPIFFTVDYKNHKIERLNPIEFIQAYTPTRWPR